MHTASHQRAFHAGMHIAQASLVREYLDQAWAADFNDRARDSGFASPRGVFDVQDIDVSRWWPTIDPSGKPPLLSEPIPVWKDGDVEVTATLVYHELTAPSFAFRFDTPDGSVTVSGDTTVSQNLIALAQGTDYLVHEVVDPAWVESVAATLPPQMAAPLIQHLIESHTTIEQVGRDVSVPARWSEEPRAHPPATGGQPEGPLAAGPARLLRTTGRRGGPDGARRGLTTSMAAAAHDGRATHPPRRRPTE